MRFDVLTLFPGFFVSPLRKSIIGRAVASGLLSVEIHNIRDFAADRHRTVDDYPYGGGPGMVMKPEPVVRAIESVTGESKKAGLEKTKVILTTPQGRVFNQKMAGEFSGLENVIIVCGRYEGVDERIRGHVDMEVSVGDYILTGGELPALVIIDAVGRLVKGVLGKEESARTESFSGGLLEYPQYTRPEEFRGMRVPEILLSGNHQEIQRWRRRESLRRTLERRPDLLRSAHLTEQDRRILEDLKREVRPRGA